MKTIRTMARKIEAGDARMQKRRVGFLVVWLIIGSLVAACGGGSQSPAPTLDTPATDAAAASQGTPTGQGRLPGPEEFGMTTEELVSSVEAVESLIATCMSDAGFEYIAVDYDTIRRGMVADKSLPGVSDEDFIAQYGYGISTTYTGLPPQLSELATPAQIGLGEQNVRIFNSLSSADQVAYSRTLFGENTDATFAVSLEVEDFSRTGGCTRAAIEQVFSSEQLSATYLNPLDALIEQDPRMIAAVEEFADCVRAEGFNYNHPNEIEPDIRNRLAAITQGVPLESLSADAQAALTELQGYERAIAELATQCEEDILEPVQAQIERELYGGPQP
ncbi:MAG TPA: hypothetical protein VJG32_16750 [Anaerolineae bacterium]|nr:hypothetical protein [Anaerolineae bacterium]